MPRGEAKDRGRPTLKKCFTYTYRVDPQQFRRALYFNTFSKQRLQIVLVTVMWVLGLGLLFANLVFRVPMSNVMQLCYAVLTAALPLLVFSCESGYRRYRSSPASDKLRTVSLCEDWVKLSVVGGADSEKLEWHMLASVFELPETFIIYRDAELMVLLPKAVVPEEEQKELRALFRLKLGRAFHLRNRELIPGL
mgnify:CR=1 FL=1